MRRHITPKGALRGEVVVPGDKSLSHRALLLGALAEGETRVAHLGSGDDVRATARCLRALGVDVALDDDGGARVVGRGLSSLRAPDAPLDCGNSGTTMRLLSGVVAGAGVPAVLDGDEGLRRRPMRRVTAPLVEMSALIDDGDHAPLHFRGGALVGRAHELPVASAQLKSALLLAGLFAKGTTRVVEPGASRDHTERMLRAMGAPYRVVDGGHEIEAPSSALAPLGDFTVPGDPSSAAFLIAAATLVEDSEVVLPGVAVNPTRLGFVRVLQRMGADVVIYERRDAGGEPVATVRARASSLRAVEVGAAEIPALVDEVPLLALVATQARGTTRVTGAAELRVKESDRLAETAKGLRELGANVDELDDGLVIEGPTPLREATLSSSGDHRLAMTWAIAGLIAEGGVVVDGAQWASVSWPSFFDDLDAL